MQTTNQSDNYYNDYERQIQLREELFGHPNELELIEICLQQIVDDNDLVIS